MTLLLPLLVAGILATQPASGPDGRMLTVAESVGQADHSVYPEQVRLYWTPEGELTREFPRRQAPEWKLPQSERPGIVYGESVSRNEFGINGGARTSLQSRSIPSTTSAPAPAAAS